MQRIEVNLGQRSYPIFIGAGPAFAQGREVQRVRNVDLYELMTHVLGLRPAPNDGSLDSIKAVLR